MAELSLDTMTIVGRRSCQATAVRSRSRAQGRRHRSRPRDHRRGSCTTTLASPRSRSPSSSVPWRRSPTEPREPACSATTRSAFSPVSGDVPTRPVAARVCCSRSTRAPCNAKRQPCVGMAPRTVRYWLNRFRQEGLAIFPRRLVARAPQRPRSASGRQHPRRRQARRQVDGERVRAAGRANDQTDAHQDRGRQTPAGEGEARGDGTASRKTKPAGGVGRRRRAGLYGRAGVCGRAGSPRRREWRPGSRPAARRTGERQTTGRGRASASRTRWPKRPSRPCAFTSTA